MLRLKATKTSLYKLVAEHVPDLPPMRTGTEFWKAPGRSRSFYLNWITPDWNRAQAFFSTCMGRPLLSVTVKEDGRTVSREVYGLTVADLQERGMVEEFTTAAERRRLEREADNSGLTSAT